MPRGKHLVRQYRGVFRPVGKINGPIAPPPQPADSEQSALPPAYLKDRTKKEKG
jgi:hypothetical protein